MPVPTDRRYTESHEWCKVEGDQALIGITQYAADQLTDITFVDLPEVGSAVSAGEPFGEIESVKSASDLNTPVSGEVLAVNDALADGPGVVNSDPFGGGWMIRIRLSKPEQVDRLQDAATYEASLPE